MISPQQSQFARTLSRIFFGAMLVAAFVVFVLWRTDNPRVDAARVALVDMVAPTFESVAGPSASLSWAFEDIQSYSELQAENTRLRQEVRRLKPWREYAHRLEEENSRLRALNEVKLPPRLTFATAEVIADAGGPYGRSVIINLGRDDGVEDGAPALDGAGLVGRVVGVGERSARVILLTDANSRVPVAVGDARSRAILLGDDDERPSLRFLDPDAVATVGARVLTSGDGGVFPADLLIGRVATLDGDVAEIALEADYRRLEFLRVRHTPGRARDVPSGGLILRAQDVSTSAADESDANPSADE